MDFEFPRIEVASVFHVIFCLTKALNCLSESSRVEPSRAGWLAGPRRWQGTPNGNWRGQQQLASQQRPRGIQQKPLTLYGLGLINQIMDFSSGRSLAALCLRLFPSSRLLSQRSRRSPWAARTRRERGSLPSVISIFPAKAYRARRFMSLRCSRVAADSRFALAGRLSRHFRRRSELMKL